MGTVTQTLRIIGCVLEVDRQGLTCRLCVRRGATPTGDVSGNSAAVVLLVLVENATERGSGARRIMI